MFNDFIIRRVDDLGIDLCFDIKIQKCRKFLHFFLMQRLALFLVKSQIGENTQKLVKLLSTTAFNATSMHEWLKACK